MAAYFGVHSGSERFALFWVGLGLLLLSSLFVSFRDDVGEKALTGLVLALGAVSYLPKLFRSYARPARYDEVLHIGQAHLLMAGTILGHNSVDPTVGLYPLYQMLVDGAHYLTRLPLWPADLLVAGLGHTVTIWAVFLLTRELTGNRRVATFAAVLYTAGPAVLFALSEAAYESVGLPLALLACVFCLKASRAGKWSKWHTTAVITMGLAVITQPVSGLFLTAFLLLLGSIDSFNPASRYGRSTVRGISDVLTFGVLALSLNLIWIASVGWNVVWTYVLPSGNLLSSAWNAIIHLGHHRAFYQGSGLPRYEQLCGLAAVLVLPLLILAAAALYWRRRRFEIGNVEPVAVWAGLAMGVVFVGSDVLLLSPTLGFIWVHRSWELLWVGVSILLAYLFDWLLRVSPASRLTQTGIGLIVMLLFLGYSATTTPADYMFAGKYRFESSVDLLTQDQLAAARWLKSHAPGARIVSDQDTEDVDWAYGDAVVVGFPTWELTFHSRPIWAAVHNSVDRARIGYLVVDKLMYKQRSVAGYIYTSSEPPTYANRPLPLSAYRQLLRTRWLHLAYSNGQISIFRVTR